MAGETTIGKLIVRVLMDATGYDREADKVTRKTKGMGDLLTKTADVLGGVFVTATKAATAAAAGLAAASVVVGANFEKAISKVAAVKGIQKTSDEFKALETRARELGAATMFSATEAAQGMEELARAGLSTTEIIAASNDVLKLAAAADISLADAASIAASSMAQFGIDAEETGRITDVFTAATQNSLFSMTDLAEAMKFAGTAGAAVGYTIEETTAAVAQFRDLGLEGSMAGVQFRTMMSALVRPTSQAEAALAEIGLTVEDVNPTVHEFGDILQTLAEHGMTAEQSLAIFSQRAGLNVQKLVDGVAEGTSSLDDLLITLENSAGTTENSYAIMTDNVSGKFAELKSAAEEFLLGLFDTFKGPLADLLAAVTKVLRLTGEQFSGAMDDASGFGEILARLAAWIDENAVEMASQIATVLDTTSRIASLISSTLLPVLTSLVPVADELLFLFGAIWATQKITTFLPILISVVTATWAWVAATGSAALATGTLSGAVGVLAGAITAATGGLNLAVGAIVALVAGLAYLTKELLAATSATEDLAAAQRQIAEEAQAAEYWFGVMTEGLVENTRAWAVEQKAAAAEAGTLTEAMERQYDAMIAMDTAEAQRLVRRGEMIKVGEGLIAVEDLLANYGEEGVQALRDEIAATARLVEILEEWVASTEDPVQRGAYQRQLDIATRKLQGMRSALASHTAEQTRAARAAEETSSSADDLRSELDELTASTHSAASATEQLSEEQQEAQQAIEDLAERVPDLRDELAQIGLDDDGRLEWALAKKREAIEADHERALLAEELTAQEIEAIHADREEALRLVELIGAARRREARLEEERRAAKEAARIAEREAEERAREEERIAQEAANARLADFESATAELNRVRRAGMTEAERLEEDFQRNVMPTLYTLAAEEQEEIVAAHAAELERLRKAERKGWGGVFKGIAKAGRAAFDAVSGAVKGMAAAVAFARDKFGEILSVVESLTGATFSLSAAMGAVSSAVSDASEDEDGNAVELTPEQVGDVASTAAADFMQGIVTNASQFATAFLSALPEILGALPGVITEVFALVVEMLPVVIQEFVEAIPLIVAALAEGIPQIILALVNGIPAIVQALVEALPTLVAAIASAIPVLIETLLAQLPTIIQGIIAALPPLISALLEGVSNIVAFLAETLPKMITDLMSGLPQIIEQILGAVPQIVTELLGAIPDIVRAVVNGIPEILTAVLGSLPAIIIALIDGVLLAIPEIIVAVVEAIPAIVIAITDAIPAIVMAVVNRIPLIITSLVGAIPTIITAVIQALPTIITAIIGMIPQIVLGIVAAIPEIIVALFTAFFVELPRQIPAIVVELVKAIGEAILGALRAVGEAIADFFTNIFTKDSDGDGVRDKKDADPHDPEISYSGVNYVPATMRMTLHKGEAVIPANRNPRGATSGVDPALAGAVAFQGAGGGAGGGKVEIGVSLGGQVVDRVLVDATRAGKAPGVTRMIRKEAGTRVGYDVGRFSRWNK